MNKRSALLILMNSCWPIGGPFAVMLSASSILVLLYGALGITGSSIFTGLFLSATLAAIFIPSVREFRLLPADYLFVFYAGWIGVSLIANGQTSDIREWGMMSLSLAAYPTCRLITDDVRSAIVQVTGPVVALGAIVTAWALIIVDNIQGKPLVFGFSNVAATFFLNLLGFVAIAFATTPLTWRRACIFSGLIFLPAAIFAAAMVRFAFIAIVGSLVLLIFTSQAAQRKYLAAIIFGLVLAAAAGLSSRYEMTLTYVGFAAAPSSGGMAENRPAVSDELPSCHLTVNKNNSIALRTMLLRDSFSQIPRSGLTGTGLGSFTRMSCLSMEPHNSFLQATLEFGWIGGICLLALVVLAGSGLMHLARDDTVAQFAFGGLAFVIANSLVYGHTSRDMLLFGFLGWAVGIREQSIKRILRARDCAGVEPGRSFDGGHVAARNWTSEKRA